MDEQVSSSADEGKGFHTHQKFRFYDISWRVDKYYIQSCSENWEICTPELDGPQNSKVILILKRMQSESRSNFNLSFIVKRSQYDDIEPETLWINFSMHISGKYINDEDIVNNRLCYLYKGRKNESNFILTEDLVGKIDEPDSLNIYCEIILYVKDQCVEFDDCIEHRLRSLSNDMLDVYLHNLDHDIRLKFGDFFIPGHKSILSARSGVMNRKIDNESKKQKSDNFETIDLSDCRGKNFDPEEMTKVIKFIYTGDLLPLLQKPSLSLYHLAQTFNVQDIKDCYAEERLCVLSFVDTCDFVIMWHIHDFDSACENNKHLLTPFFTEDNSSRTWQFHLYFRRKQDTEYAAIFAETHDYISMNVSLEISVIDKGGHTAAVKILRKCIDCYNMFGFEEFARKDWLKSATTHDTLTLRLSLKLSAGRQSSEVERHLFSTVNRTVSRSFEKLSKDMRSLFESGTFSDAVVHTRDGSVLIHTGIVEVRCRYFYYMLIDKQGEDGSIVIENMDHDVIRTILIYIYSGFISVEEEDNLLKIFKASKEFELKILELACKKLILDLLHKEDDCLNLKQILKNKFEIDRKII